MFVCVCVCGGGGGGEERGEGGNGGLLSCHKWQLFGNVNADKKSTVNSSLETSG